VDDRDQVSRLDLSDSEVEIENLVGYVPQIARDEDGLPILDADGHVIPLLDENGNPIFAYGRSSRSSPGDWS
jgi:hypothetical protein